MKTELLAPAKNKETAFAAIDCGADAVYIGASSFGARQNACNSLEDIKEVVEYAHKFWAKVYVTVNTILTNEELKEAVNLINELNEIGTDAILVQDMGLLNKLIELKLPIPIHASTQCDNREEEKVEFFRKIGLSRVVLARELSLEKIKYIHEKNPDIELEAFVHGALCVSYSGQCYLSQYIGGRSANRGECAQPCRKKYTLLDDKGNIIKQDFYALCLKDFNASKNIKEMIDSGVFSFKIEGRLKDIGYVKNIVSCYRQELDKYSDKISSGKPFYSYIPDAEKSFNRGFTDYFQKGRTDCYILISPKSMGKYIGVVKDTKCGKIFVKTGMEINSQDGLCFINNDTLDGFLVNKAEKTEGGYIIHTSRSLFVKNGTKIYRNSDVQFDKDIIKPTKRQIGINVEVFDNKVVITDEDKVSISVEILGDEKAKNQEKMNEIFVKQFTKTGDSDFYVTDIRINSDVPFIPISAINQLRRDSFDKLMRKRLDLYKRETQKPMNYTKFYKNELDYRANIYNKESELFYEKCGAVVNEYAVETKFPNRQIELMRTKHCIKYALKMCKSPKKLILQDEKGAKYPLMFDCKNCEMVVLSPNG